MFMNFKMVFINKFRKLINTLLINNSTLVHQNKMNLFEQFKLIFFQNILVKKNL